MAEERVDTLGQVLAKRLGTALTDGKALDEAINLAEVAVKLKEAGMLGHPVDGSLPRTGRPASSR